MEQPWTRARDLMHASRRRQSARLLALAGAVRAAGSADKDFEKWAAALQADAD